MAPMFTWVGLLRAPSCQTQALLTKDPKSQAVNSNITSLAKLGSIQKEKILAR
jgi:hypothetical protein